MQPSSVVSTLDTSHGASYSLQRPRVDSADAKEKKPRRHSTASRRVRRDSQLYNLTLDVHDLKQEIHHLALRRQLLQTRALYASRLTAERAVLRKAAHYLKCFAHGYRGRHTHASQDAFVRSIAGEDFSIGVTGLGVSMLLEQWRRYTELFHLRETEVQSMGLLTQNDENEDMVVKCVVHLHGIFTRDAVSMIFPSATREPQQLLRLLGRKMVCPTVFHLYFNTRGQLVRHDSDGDFFSAVHCALGGDYDAAFRLMDSLQLGQEGMVGPIRESEDEADSELHNCDEKLKDTEVGVSSTQRHSLAFLLSNIDTEV